MSSQWNEPKTSRVSLATGEEIETEVNGKTLDGTQGWILVNGVDTPVIHPVDTFEDVWDEACAGCKRFIDVVHVHQEKGVKRNYCSVCFEKL